MAVRVPRSWRYVLHRGIALGLTMALHLAAFVFITRPVADEERKNHAPPQSWQALQLRLIRSAVPLPSYASITAEMHAAAAQPQRTGERVPSKKWKVAATQASPVPPVSQQAAPDSNAAKPVIRTLPPAPATAVGDGGFADRLRQASRSYSVGPLPGSDTPRVSGIRLIDPKTQGIAATMLQAQRLFGITNHHCIDVDVWNNMTPRELAAYHISPSDVAKVDAKNNCNRPLGLSF